MVESGHSAAAEGAGKVAGWFRWPSVEELIEGRSAGEGAGLPSPLLEHSVRLEPDAVRILDRRVFPHEVTWVTARSGAEVADAMRQMVTQSTGPIFAAMAGLVLTARQQAGRSAAEAVAAVRETGALLIGARPTNNSVGDAVRSVLSAIDVAMEADASGSGTPPGSSSGWSSRLGVRRASSGLGASGWRGMRPGCWRTVRGC